MFVCNPRGLAGTHFCHAELLLQPSDNSLIDRATPQQRGPTPQKAREANRRAFGLSDAIPMVDLIRFLFYLHCLPTPEEPGW